MCIKKRTIAKNRNDRIITREEEFNMIDVLRNREHIKAKSYYPDVADLIEVLIDTGIRKLEALELRYSYVDFDNNLIIIRVTKGPHHRRIPMTKKVATILRRRQEIDQHKPFNLNDMQISMAWNWVRDQIGLRNDREFVLHALRRTCGFRMMEARIDMGIVQEILTSRCRTSSRRFAPIPIHKLNQAAELFEEWLK